MKTLLLVALLVVSSLSATITIDCSTGSTQGSRNFGCASTYQAQLNFTTPAGAFGDWLQFCLSTLLGGGVVGNTGIVIGGGDTLNIIGSCDVSGSLLDFPAAFTGINTSNFTIAGQVTAGGGTPTLNFNGGFNGNQIVVLGSDPTVGGYSGGVVLTGFTINGNGRPVAIVTADRGNVFVSNLNIVDVNSNGNGNALFSHAGTSNGFIPGTSPAVGQMTLSLDTVDISQSSAANFAFANNNMMVVAVQTGVDVVMNAVTIHDMRTGSAIVLVDGTGTGTTSITVNGLTATNIDYRESCGFILCGSGGGQNNPNPTFSRDNYAVSLTGVSVSSSAFGGSQFPLVQWNPDYNSVDGTFAMTTTTISKNTFSSLTNAININGRGQTDFTNGMVTTNTITFPAQVNSFYFVDNTDGATITGSTFSDNTQFSWGMVHTGAFSANSIISGNTFTGNIATSRRQWTSAGGACHLEGSSTLTTNTFTSNYAENGGAVFVEDNADAFFVDSTFTSNNASAASRRVYAVGNGGAVLKNLDGITTFTNCVFDSNNANHGGGAISALVDKVLGSTTYQGAGQFIYFGDGGDVQINNSTFSNNVAAEFGGALLFNSRNLIVSDTNMTGNTAQTGGAASSVDVNPFVSSPLLFRNVQMLNNVATGGVISTTTLKDGGAVSSFRALTFKQVLCQANSAQSGNGGAVTAYKGLDAEYSNFKSNTAVGVGGAIWSQPVQPDQLRLFRSDFLDNSGTDGGAVWSNNPQTLFDGATFSNNVASGNGGAVFLNTEATISGTGFTLNSAAGNGGAVYSVGDVTVSNSRFDSNFAAGNGGGILCVSNPIGQVDFTLHTSGDLFTNNTAGAVGGAIDTSCTMVDVGSTFTNSVEAADSYGVECNGADRVLRGCELSFTNSRFETDTLGILSPPAPLGSLSTGLVIAGSTFFEFTGFDQAESTSISSSTFDSYKMNVESPTTIDGSTFTSGTDNYLSGTLTVTNSHWHQGNVNVSSTGAASFDTSSFESTNLVTYSGGATLTDVTATSNSNLTFNGPATLTRLNVDSSSSTTLTQTTTISDSVAGTFTASTGTIVLTGSLTLGGDGLTSSLSIPVSGTGDLIVAGGTFTWLGGAITGSGKFLIQAGEAHLQSGAALDRMTTADANAVVFIDGNPSFTLSAEFDAMGGAVFGQGTVSIASSGSGASFNTWKDTFFGSDSTVGPASHNYGNYHFGIQDRNTYDKVAFSTSFVTQNTSYVFAQDARTVFEYNDVDLGNGSTYLRDVGNRFTIITLPTVFDIEACSCVSPFAGAVYTYNVSVQYPDQQHSGYPGARISTRNQTSNDATIYLYLYSDASSFRPFGMLLVVLLALLF